MRCGVYSSVVSRRAISLCHSLGKVFTNASSIRTQKSTTTDRGSSHLDSVRVLAWRVPPPRRQHVPEEVKVHEATPGTTGILSVLCPIPTIERITVQGRGGARGGANGKPRGTVIVCVAPGVGMGRIGVGQVHRHHLAVPAEQQKWYSNTSLALQTQARSKQCSCYY